MEATCPISNKKFTISAAEKKYCQDRSIPLPQMHPHERMRRILSFRNRTFLYNETCALTKKNILSQIPPGRGFTVYETDAWNSDQWDAMAYGQDYDPTRSFFDQISELLKKVPLPNLTVVKASLENSDYCNGAVNLKNCYLCFASVNSSDCMFCWNAAGCKDVVDCISPLESELCYNCLDIDHCYRLYYSQACNYCSESYFLEGCQSCKNCFGCVNLTNKQYCWYNEQLTKEQYEERIGQLNLGNWDVVESELKKFNDFKKQFPRKSLQGRNNETVSGNYLHNCKDCKNLFHSDGSIDVENSIGTNKCKDSFCSAFNRDGELVYNTQAGVGNYNNQFCAECVQTRDLMYCLYCVQGTSDCLGCVSLKKKQYCILNKQYSKEEYEKLAAQIKKQLTEECAWEEFFPAKLSPIYYNESDGMIILPLTREEALNRGFAWKDDQGEKAAPTNIAKTISDVDDSVLQSTYTCEKTGKKYRIVKPELDFYRKMNIPLPHIAPLPRVHQLASIFRITDLLLVKCGHCQNDIETVYDPNERKVLCEECYLQTTY